MMDRRKTGERRNHLMTDAMVAELASVSVNTVRYWRQKGLLPFVKVGRHPRVWHSVFLKVFQKPLPLGFDTMPSARDIRRAV